MSLGLMKYLGLSLHRLIQKGLINKELFEKIFKKSLQKVCKSWRRESLGGIVAIENWIQ